MPVNADVVVIGAGVLGSSIALELARCGHSVTVVDKAGGAGHGSTSASSAIVRFNFSNRSSVAAAWEAKFCWEAWSDHVELPADDSLARYRRTGLIMLDVDVAPRELFLPLFDEVGVPYAQWDSATLAANIPGIDTGRHWPPVRVDDERFWTDPTAQLGAVFTPDAGFVQDPGLATGNLATAAARRGVTFLFRQKVVEVLRERDRVAGVRLEDGQPIHSPIVVNAAGPWSGMLNKLANVGTDFTVGVRPLRQEVHYVTAPAGILGDADLGPIIGDLDLGTYIRPEVGGGLLIGGTEPECDTLHWLNNPDDVAVHPTKAVFDAQVMRAARRLPRLGVPEQPKGIVGVYDAADDWTPIYDRTELPGFYVAMGTSGNQFKNAPLVGQFMAAIIDGVENGVDHDEKPIQFTAKHTKQSINLGAFSRQRGTNTQNSGTVFG